MAIHSTSQRLLTIGAVVSFLYCIAAMWFVATSPDIGLRCLLTSETPFRPGLEIRALSTDLRSHGDAIASGDTLIELNGEPIYSFVDYARELRNLRSAVPRVGARLKTAGFDTRLLQETDPPRLVESEEGQRYVLCRIRTPDEQIRRTYVELTPPPAGAVLLTLLWLMIETPIVLLSGIACWRRPFDQPLNVFFATTFVSLVAFVGGNHWWVIGGIPALIIPFGVAATLFPAVLFQFFLTFPAPKEIVRQHPKATFGLIYGIPTLVASIITVLIALSWWLSADYGPGPLARGTEAVQRQFAAMVLHGLRYAIQAYLLVAGGYFIGSLAAALHSIVHAQNVIERNQVKWILWAGILAAIPVTYSLFLALFRRTDFALGAAQLPMFLAGASFMVAYAIGIARHKLLLIDQVLTRGMWYYVSNSLLSVVFSLSIALGVLYASRNDLGLLNRTLPLIGLLILSVLTLTWMRDRIQRWIDRQFFGEKYQLDRALQRMNRAVANLLERDAVASNLLNSCCEVLRVELAALYLWDHARTRFSLAAIVGKGDFPPNITVADEVLLVLKNGASFQRVPGATSPEQSLIRRLGTELVTGLEIDSEVAGFLTLGSKPNGMAYTAEDATFLNALGRITGVAFHCARVHEDLTRLNDDLQSKSVKIVEQERQIAMLQSILDSISPNNRSANEPAEGLQRTAIVGHGPAMTEVLETVRKVSSSDASVLVRGESGTGKELLARTLHENSPRRNGPLVSVHCAALSPSLLESELFGHVKGAFTDAREDKVGRFALAHSGTLFLDEIGDISLDVQVKLLRVLQERTFEPVGSTKPVQVDVRIIAATHQNLERLIQEHRFREDLYYRLNVITVTLPALRERREDILELAAHFLKGAAEREGRRITRIDDAALEALMNYSWPGNIRELQNAVNRSVVLAENDIITLKDLPTEIRRPGRSSATARVVEPKLLGAPLPVPRALSNLGPTRTIVVGSDDERGLLAEALQKCGGNKTEAAKILGMPRSTFFFKLKRHGLK
ncbi:sigma-54-dependent Fis family transcriptional regulator [Planctomyces sp. SH-PL14]|uniref:sigma-54-dependent Fis family transcriptional regulator n=1 Tax=Planctomyces sp. SH-PL14 TaxID=1632864 RepID=UPI00078D9612|nr:sigma-54-dependent Fis family transcriptional regulator [Planctomyces sp. SH-PL14]AMV21394.1 Transcriptional regulatory protein ZraR [Planctomyces sp. SH-PL14]